MAQFVSNTITLTLPLVPDITNSAEYKDSITVSSITGNYDASYN